MITLEHLALCFTDCLASGALLSLGPSISLAVSWIFLTSQGQSTQGSMIRCLLCSIYTYFLSNHTYSMALSMLMTTVMIRVSVLQRSMCFNMGLGP